MRRLANVLALWFERGERERKIVFQAGDEHGYSITRADDFIPIIIIEENYSQLI